MTSPTLTRRTAAARDGRRRRVLATLRATDVYALLAAGAGALCLTWLVFDWVAPFDGLLGFIVVAYGLFLALYALIVSFDETATAVVDRLVAAVVTSLGLLLLTALVFIVVFTFVRGAAALVHLNFYLDDMSLAGPLQGLEVGGVRHGVVGTLQQISIALTITVPLGLTSAVFLNELPGPYARFVRTIVEAMTALPSIIAGLFVYSTLLIGVDVAGRTLKLPKSGFAAALAISVMMLPIIIRASDVVLRLVPGTLKEASYALGASQWRTILTVVLPTARSGLTTAIILGTARGIGETSPVLITAGLTSETNWNAFTGAPQVSMPLLTFSLVRSPQPVQVQRGFGAASVLLVLVLVLFVLARMLGGRGPGQLSRRQAARAGQQSHDDLRRFEQRHAGAFAHGLLPRGRGAPPPDAVPGDGGFDRPMTGPGKEGQP